MPRATSSGSARVAQRMRVLAHLAAHPNQPIREASRALDVAESSIRSIKRRWGVAALQSGNFGHHSGGGRPQAKPDRWKRSATLPGCWFSLALDIALWQSDVTLSTYTMSPLCTQAVETPGPAQPVLHVQMDGEPDGAVGDEGELLPSWRGRLPQPHPSVWNDSAAVPEGHGHYVLQVCHPFTEEGRKETMCGIP